jgi:hypothetical protein
LLVTNCAWELQNWRQGGACVERVRKCSA